MTRGLNGVEKQIPPVASKSSTMNTLSEGEKASNWHCTVAYTDTRIDSEIEQ